jgi:hypothetical protein
VVVSAFFKIAYSLSSLEVQVLCFHIGLWQ